MYDIGKLKLFFLENQILFVVLAFMLVVIFAYILLYLFRPKYKKIHSLNLYGVVWEWSWFEGKPVGIEAYCEDCGSKIVFDDQYANMGSDLNGGMTFLVCKNCNNQEKGHVKGGDRKYVLKLVTRQIMIMKNELK